MNRTNRARRDGRMITGPHSAMTDYLASLNVSAHEIRHNHEERRRQALTAEENGAQEAVPGAPADENAAPERAPETTAQRESRKRKEKKAIEAIKATRKFKRAKKVADESEDDDDIALALIDENSKPLPGQLENCAICDTRFTVTSYTAAGPDGGLLCTKCAKELAKDDDSKPKKKMGPAASARRRKLESRILDGESRVGVKSLTQLCVETLAKNIDGASDLGDMPQPLINKISGILARRWLLDSQTLDLFLRADAKEINIFDGAKLTTDDYIRIFQTCPLLESLRIRNAIHFGDPVMDYLLTRHINLTSLSLHGANLLTSGRWTQFLTTKGSQLKTLKVYCTDLHVADDFVKTVTLHCPGLQRLKLSGNQMVTDEGVAHIAALTKLEHLSLSLQQPKSPETYVKLLEAIGGQLRTLSIKEAPDLDDTVLAAIHDHCKSLTKLRLTESETATDAGFARLFTGWSNPPLTFVDLEKCRYVDADEPRNNADDVGLCSAGFRALMAHSGQHLRFLNLHACRNITPDAFDEAFELGSQYPELAKFEVSFIEAVDDVVVGRIFKASPQLHELNVFGCMRVHAAMVPRGKVLVGVPNAMGMVLEGEDN